MHSPDAFIYILVCDNDNTVEICDTDDENENVSNVEPKPSKSQRDEASIIAILTAGDDIDDAIGAGFQSKNNHDETIEQYSSVPIQIGETLVQTMTMPFDDSHDDDLTEKTNAIQSPGIEPNSGSLKRGRTFSEINEARLKREKILFSSLGNAFNSEPAKKIQSTEKTRENNDAMRPSNEAIEQITKTKAKCTMQSRGLMLSAEMMSDFHGQMKP